MKSKLIAAVVVIGGFAALAQTASACPAGYEPVWIQGNMVCKIKTPNFPVKAKQGRELKKGTGSMKAG